MRIFLLIIRTMRRIFMPFRLKPVPYLTLSSDGRNKVKISGNMSELIIVLGGGVDS